MAATVHVNRSAACTAVVPVGPFGSRVVEFLGSGARDCVVVPGAAVEEAFRTTADMVLLAMWRPCPSLCARADQMSYATGRPWLPVMADSAAIHVGPLVRPPGAPCYRCCLRRQAQHDSHWDVTVALHDAFERDTRLGPAGYLPHHARLAAGVAADLIDAALAPGAAEADPAVVTISLPDCVPSTTTVVPCHDCARCHKNDTREPGGTEILLRMAVGTCPAASAGRQ
jgi:bacteriocin biosynthesis cyclodehydratase domain-containing protein